MIPYKSNKKIFILFKQFLNQVAKDAMLFLACSAPVLCGLFFQFVVPYAEELLTEHFNNMAILSPYYLIFDLFLAVLTPIMFSFVSAMVILGEIDDGITNYMAVTPVGKGGYLISRLCIPSILSFFVTIIVMLIFSLTKIHFGMIMEISLLSSILGFIMSMMVVSISSNKVEGMAVTKLSGILIFGIPIPFFVSERIQYLFFPLPSLWISKYAIENNMICFILCISVSIGWILFLLKKFMRKVF